MLVQQEKEEAYFNFVNSINSEATRRNYEYCMSLRDNILEFYLNLFKFAPGVIL